MKLRWSKQARLDRQLIYQHIFEDNGAQAANTMDDRIWHSVEILSQFPLLGTATRNLKIRQRVIPHTPFLVLYSVSSERVLVKRLLHGAQQHQDRGDSL